MPRSPRLLALAAVALCALPVASRLAPAPAHGSLESRDRTPQHSVDAGGFANDPHTRGEASVTPGVRGVPEGTLRRFGLTRPFAGAAEADHIQLG